MISFDRYTLMARVLPAAVVALPVVVSADVWAPFDLSLVKGAFATTVFAAIAFALSQFTRDIGNQLEDRLLTAWGGWPSIAVLRHRDNTFDKELKARFHKRLVDLGAVERMPSAADEAANPVAADATYSAACTWLRLRTRDTKRFSFIFEENIRYGFVRNLLARKCYAVSAAVLGICSDIVAFRLGKSNGVPGAICLALILCLLLFSTRGAVWRQAMKYAKHLAEALEIIEAKRSTTPRAPRVPRR